MALVDKYFSGSENLSGVDLRNLVFKDIRDPSTNYIDSGAFGDIYYVLDKDGKENKGYVVKVIALIATIIGVFVGGILVKKAGLYKSLLAGAFLVMLTNLLFSYAAINDKDVFMLASIVASDSFAAGIVGTVNITFLTSLVSSKYTGFQYALLTSIMAFLGKVFGGFSGVLVENFQSMYGFNYGWMSFYIFTSILAVPAMLLIYLNRNFFFKNESFN